MENFEESLIQNFESALKKLGFSGEEVLLSETREDIEGDLCTNIALHISSKFKLKDSAHNLAKKIVDNLGNNPYMESARAEKNGFINVFVSKKVFQICYSNILEEKPLGFNKSWRFLEVISANPTGYLHIGHARNGIFTDTLGNILEKLGYSVRREYLVNDAGAQIKELIKSFILMWKKSLFLFGSMDKELYEQCQYKGKDMQDCVDELIKKNHLFQTDYKKLNSDQYQEIKRHVIGYFIEQIKKVTSQYQIKIDSWRSEESFVNEDSINKIIRSLGTKIIYKDGATWINLKNKPEVLIKNDGSHTYFMQDIIYHDIKLRMSGQRDRIINVWGSDHYGEIDKLLEYIKIRGLGEEKKIDFVCIQLVKLISEGKALKMSKRKSAVLYMKDLENYMNYEEVRWFFSSQPSNSPLEIELDKLKNKDYNNPVYYVMYAYSRISQILKKIENFHHLDGKLLFDDLNNFECKLFLQVARFKSMLLSAANNNSPHLLAQYLFKLAQKFHSYYEKESILKSEKKVLMQKLALLESIKWAIKEGLSLMKIKAMDVI